MITFNYINLNKRTDRKNSIELLFKQTKKIKLLRFNAICNKNTKIGCYNSHIQILENYKNSSENIFIIEDDFCVDDFKLFETKLFNIIQSKIKFDVLLFGGNILPNYKIIDTNCAQIYHSQTTTGYCVANHYIDTLLEHYKKGLYKLYTNPENHYHFSIDKYWILLQNKDKWIIIFPLIVYQKESYSDIENKIINYKFLMLDSEKKYLSF